MAKPPYRRKPTPADRHTAKRYKLGMPQGLAELLEQMARDDHSDIAETIRTCVRNELRRRGYMQPRHEPEGTP